MVNQLPCQNKALSPGGCKIEKIKQHEIIDLSLPHPDLRNYCSCTARQSARQCKTYVKLRLQALSK